MTTASGKDRHWLYQSIWHSGLPSNAELHVAVPAELKMVFRLTDRNKDGSITAEELKRMLLDKLDIQVDDALIGDLMTSAGENGASLVGKLATASPSLGNVQITLLHNSFLPLFSLYYYYSLLCSV